MACAAHGVLAADFDGDGIDDLLFRDRTRGDHRLGLVLGAPGAPAGGERRSLLLSAETLRQRGFEVRTADFDGDGRSDVLDRDLEGGRIRIRLMDGVTVRATGSVQGAARQADIQAVADFTGDGRADVLLRGGLTGEWTLFAMWGTQIDEAGSGQLAVPADFAWRLNAAADFNGDGRTDLLLRRADTLRWRLLSFDGTRTPLATTPDFLPLDPQWQLESVTDLNGDHRADLLFRHRESGAWYAWHMDGARALPSSGPVTLSTTLGWQLQLLDDLNGDNTRDAVYARLDPSNWRVDFLQGAARLADSGLVAGDTPATMRIADSGDYDGDGARELLVSSADGWQLVNLRNPAAPQFTSLDLPSPRAWPLVCDPPIYPDSGSRNRPAEAGSDTAFLTWAHPATRENGEALCPHELAGYRIQYYREGATKVHTLQIPNPRADNKLLGPLVPGTWYFRILSVDSNGYFSQSSPGIAKTVP